jgi:hypothetical protein
MNGTDVAFKFTEKPSKKPVFRLVLQKCLK